MLSYRQGWRALNRLLHEDKSFSGHERNCAFLNMGDGRFASVSSVTGLDFDDDSRALASCDWDFDGKLDFWITARTAPRLRLVRNRKAASGRFIAFKLQGNGGNTNRDAIGARVEVVLRHRESSQRLIRTLHAGDAFLSQSSGWLHFGLGSEAVVERVIIHWPSSARESRNQSISNLEPNRFYIVRQAEETAKPWEPPAGRNPLEPNTPHVGAEPEAIRIVLPARLPLPQVTTTTGSTDQEILSLNGPLLVSLWSTNCALCLQELDEWSEATKEFQRRGLKLVALNADAGDDEGQVRAIMDRMRSRLPWAVATTESVQAIDYFQRAVLDRWQPLPVPCSFLLDRQGQVVVIYKGPIKKDQLWNDLALLDADPQHIRDAAVPFAGHWLRPVAAAQPTLVSTQMIDHGAVSGAMDYLNRFIDLNPQGSSLADVYYVRGILLESQRRYPEALESIRQSTRLNASDVRARTALANLLERFGQDADAYDEWVAAYKINSANFDVQLGLATNLLRQAKFAPAAKLLQRIEAQQPDHALVHFRLATAYRNLKQWPQAIASYRRAIELDPNLLLAANNLAWILATNPDASLRDGAQAVALAERVCTATQFEEAEFLDTLSVAYAERGDFKKAAETARKAVQILQASGRSSQSTLQPLLDRIHDFDANKPYRDAPP
jgi:tetratricopeptide (TPR) repeat protein